MDAPNDDFNKRVKQLIILGELLSVEEHSMNIVLSSHEDLFFVRGDATIAIKKAGSAIE